MRKILVCTTVYGILILVASSFYLCSCKSNRKGAKTIIPITHSAMLGGFMTCDTTDYVFVKSTLTNTSPDTLQLVSMICSWPDEYKIDTGEFGVEKNICYYNVPAIITIPPHKSFSRYVRLFTNKRINSFRNTQFRLGCNIVIRDTTKQLFPLQTDELPKMNNVVWSDTIRFKDFYPY